MLKQIGAELQQIAETIKAIVGIDITIMDSEYYYRTSKYNYYSLSDLQQNNLKGGGGLKITSSSIKNGKIPLEFGFRKENKSPQITISGVSEDTKKLLLLMYDPDAKKVSGKVFIHWIVLLDPKGISIEEGNSDNSGTNFINDFNRNGYGGPAPPKGTTHTYYIAVYALNDDIKFKDHETYESIRSKIKDHIVDKDEISGIYPPSL